MPTWAWFYIGYIVLLCGGCGLAVWIDEKIHPRWPDAPDPAEEE